MQTATINYHTSQFHYSWFGAGKKILLCLHGYGESEQSFHFLENDLPHDYLVIAIDFPFHVKTAWNETSPFTIDHLLAVIQQLRLKHGDDNTRLTILGFSMGGRVGLHLLEKIPEQIEKVILLAP